MAQSLGPVTRLASQDTLHFDARYIAAWSEINARIVSRDRSSHTCIAVTIAVLAAAFAVDNPSAKRLVLLLGPLCCLIMTELFVAHDGLIGLLSRHLCRISEAANQHFSWDWHGKGEFSTSIIVQRTPMYVAHLLAVWFLGGAALLLSWPFRDPPGIPISRLISGEAMMPASDLGQVLWILAGLAWAIAATRTFAIFIQRVVWERQKRVPVQA